MDSTETQIFGCRRYLRLKLVQNINMEGGIRGYTGENLMNKNIPDQDGGHSPLDARGSVDGEPDKAQVTPEVEKWIVNYYRELVRVASGGKFRGHYGPFLGAAMRYHAALYQLRHPYLLDRIRNEKPDYFKHMTPEEFITCSREIGFDTHPDLVKAFNNLPESADGWKAGNQTAIRMSDPSTGSDIPTEAVMDNSPPQAGGFEETSLADLLKRPISEVVSTLLTLKSMQDGISRDELEREVLNNLQP